MPVVCAGFILGVGIGGGYSPVSVFVWEAIGLFGFLLFMSNLGINSRLAGLLMASLLLGGLYSDATVRSDERKLALSKSIANRVVKITATVKDVEERDSVLVVSLKNITMAEMIGYKFPGYLRVNIPATEAVMEGDIIRLIGKIEIPQSYDRGRVGHFDPARYYSRYGIYGLVENARLQTLTKGRPDLLTRLRMGARARFQKYLPEPSAGLFSATLLGYMRDVPKDLRDDFSASGLAHLVAISGQHVSMLAVVIFLAITYTGLSRGWATVLTVLLSFLFIALVDFPPSGIRSVIMAGLVSWSYLAGRKTQGLRALLFAASLMLLFNPRILLADLGFQLSVLALFGLLVIYPLLKKLYFPLKQNFILNVFMMTLCATVATTPIIAFAFGRISFVGLIANVIAAPLYPALMIMGVSSLALGWWPIFQVFFIPFAHLSVVLFLRLVNISANLPLANISVRDFSAIETVAVYVVIVLFPLCFSKESRIHFVKAFKKNKTENKHFVQTEQ